MRRQCLFALVGLTAGALIAGCTTGTTTPPNLPPASIGPVTLAVGATLYHRGDTIWVAIANQDASPIYFQDHQTDCTVLQLQIQTASGWQVVGTCAVSTPTGWHTLGPSESQVVVLPPSGGGWAEGIYRAVLTYYPAPSVSGGTIVYSAGFQVQG
jgi:hypothetical protein